MCADGVVLITSQNKAIIGVIYGRDFGEDLNKNHHSNNKKKRAEVPALIKVLLLSSQQERHERESGCVFQDVRPSAL